MEVDTVIWPTWNEELFNSAVMNGFNIQRPHGDLSLPMTCLQFDYTRYHMTSF